MTNESEINVKIYKNNAVLKCLKEPICLNNRNWGDYIKALKSIQKNVNLSLTELVEQEKTGGEQANIDDMESEDDEEDDETDTIKRKKAEGDNESKSPKKIKK